MVYDGGDGVLVDMFFAHLVYLLDSEVGGGGGVEGFECNSSFVLYMKKQLREDINEDGWQVCLKYAKNQLNIQRVAYDYM